LHRSEFLNGVEVGHKSHSSHGHGHK